MIAYTRNCPLILVWLAFVGCTSAKPLELKPDPARNNLQVISGAYFNATRQLQRPPVKVEDLLPFLSFMKQEGEDDVALVEKVFRSPNDGEDYVIVWGVDFAKLAEMGSNPNVILAYEKRGKDGKRFVVVPPSVIHLLTDDEFKKAPFPPWA